MKDHASLFTSLFCKDYLRKALSLSLLLFVMFPRFVLAQNTDPVVISTPATSVNEGDDYAYWIGAVDADGDPITITGPTTPSWLSLTEVTDPVLTALAGRTFGFEDGTGTDARFARPTDTGVDGKGNVYVADRNNQVIRKITVAGVVTTLAGSGTSGFQNGTGTAAQFMNPDLITADPEGNVYVLDDSFILRKIDVNGVVTSLSGVGYGFLDGAADQARFFNPQSMIVAPDRSIYIVDFNTVRKVSPQGQVTTIAGTTTAGYNDGTGVSAAFSGPVSIAMDSKGDLYVGDNGNLVIRKVTQAGVVTTFVGSGTSGNTDGTGAGASFKDFQSMAFDASDNLYVAQFSQHNIRKVTPEGVVTAFAGSGNVGNSDGTGTEAQFVNPGGLSIDRAGNLYSAHFGAYKINKTTIPGMVLSGNSAGQAGQHPVSLNVTDGNGGSTTQNFTIVVIPDGQTPINLVGASIDSDTQITVTFDDNVQTSGANPGDFIVADGVGNNFSVTAQADGTAGDTDIVLTVSDLSGAVGKLYVSYLNQNNSIADAATGTVFASTNAVGIALDRPFITTWSVDTDGGSISIPTVSGQTYDYTIDWGDGTVETNQTGSATHSYATAGTKTVKITGTFAGVKFKDSGEEAKIQSVEQWGSLAFTSMEDAFNGCSNLSVNAIDAPGLTGVTSFKHAFKNTSFNADLSSWDVRDATDLEGMFLNNALFDGDIGGWNVLNVTKFDSLFAGNKAFNQDLSQWGTNRATSMVGMFAGAEAFNQPMDSWSMFLMKNLSGMFAGATSFNQDISAWNLFGPTNMSNMFKDAPVFNQDISGWKVDFVTDFSAMFSGATSFNQDLSAWSIARSQNLSNMLDQSGLSRGQYDALLAAWSVQNVASGLTLGAEGLFYCDSETERESLINSKSWTIDGDAELCNVQLRSATQRGATTVWAIFSHDVTTNGTNPADFIIRDSDGNSYDVVAQADGTPGDKAIVLTVPGLVNATGSLELFYINNNNEIKAIVADVFAETRTFGIPLQSPFVMTWETTTANELMRLPVAGSGYNFTIDWGDGTEERFSTDDVSHIYTTPGAYTIAVTGQFPRINQLIRSEVRSKIKSVDQWGSIFWDTMDYAFYQCSDMVLNATDAPELSRAISMTSMFAFAPNMNTDIGHWDVSTIQFMDRLFGGATTFNQDISNWDVSSVTNMEGLFSGASSFNQNINSWDVSKVTDMSSMFGGANSFNQPLDQWDVGMVTDMTFMFASNEVFNGDIGTWNTENVTSMRSMFRSVKAFNKPIGDWDVGKVEDMGNMFEVAEAFNQPIGNWNTGSVTNMNLMFSNNPVFNQDIGNWDVSKVTDFSSMFASTVFNQDIGNWNTGNATTMKDMFSGDREFNQDIGDWDVSNVVNMEGMFGVAIAFNQDISNWDVSKVDQMDMFGSALAFNQDLSSWDVRSATEISFSFSGLSSINYDKILKAWAANPNKQNGVAVGAADLKFCEAETERDQLINTNSWFFDRDAKECAPRMLSVSFDSNTQLTLTYNEIVTTNGGNPGDFIVTDVLGNVFPVTAQSDGTAGDTDIILTVTDLSTANGDVMLTYRNGHDEVASQSAVNAETNAVGLVVDNDQTSPVMSSGATLSNTQLAIIFNEAVLPNGGSASAFTVVDANNTSYTVSAISDGTEKDNELILIVADIANAVGDLVVTYTNATDEVADFGSNFLQSDATGVVISDRRAFITTWETTTAAETITIPTTGGGYNYTVNWGDGMTDTNQTGAATHTYATAGLHTVKITGSFPRIFLDETGDKDKLKSIEQWGVILWTSMERAFAGATNLSYNATDEPNLSVVTSTSAMFLNAALFNGNISSWDVSNVSNMSQMFMGASAFNQNLASWDVSAVTNISGMFQAAVAFNQDVGSWNTSMVSQLTNLFNGATAFDQSLSAWDVSNVTDLSGVFNGATSFNSSLSGWNVRAVTNMTDLFNGATSFNQDIGGWRTTALTNASQAFAGANTFNQDISGWDMANVTNISGMFSGASAFNQNIGAWNVNMVTNMAATFKDATSFNQDIGPWTITTVTNMSELFAGATAFNQALANWSSLTYNVTDMRGMFNGASSFDQSISGWRYSRVTDFSNFLDNSGLSPENLGELYVSMIFKNFMSDLTFGAAGLYYCFENATARRQNLIDRNWTITDLGERCPVMMTAINKDSDTQITVTFNQVVTTNGTNPTDFTVTDGAGTQFTVTAQADGTAGDTDIVLTVADFSTAQDVITVTYTSNNTEISGLLGLDAQTDMVGITKDIKPPTIVGMQRAGNDRVYLFFSEKVTTNETNPADFVIKDSQATVITVTEQLDAIAGDSTILLKVPGLGAAIGDITIGYVNNNEEVKDLTGTPLETTTIDVGLSTDPFFTSEPVTVANDGDMYTYKITVSDPNFDPTSVTGITVPSWLTLSSDTEVTTLTEGTIHRTGGTPQSRNTFHTLAGLALDDLGNIYLSDWLRNVIVRVDPFGGVSDFTYLNDPGYLVFDSQGNLFVESGGNRIYKVTPDGQSTIFAGSGLSGSRSPNGLPNYDGSGTNSGFFAVAGMTIDGADNLYLNTGAWGVASWIRKVTPQAVVTSLITNDRGFRDGPFATAQIGGGFGMGADNLGNIYVGDLDFHRIRKLGTDGIVSTLAGGEPFSFSDGTGSEAGFASIAQMAFDDDNNLYLADLNNGRIRKVTTDGVVTTIAGSGIDGHKDGPALEATFIRPRALVRDEGGTIYIGEDSDSNLGFVGIRRMGKVYTLKGDATGNIGTHDVVIEADDGNGGTVTQTFTITVIDGTTPLFTSPVTVSVAENTSGVFYTAVATDNGVLTYSLGGLLDESLFNIDVNTGELSFMAAPDFENPLDGDTNNEYLVEVLASDGTNEGSMTLRVRVTDKVDEIAPTVTLTAAGIAPVAGVHAVTAQFSEDVIGFDVTDITISGGTVSNFVMVNASTYTFDVTSTVGAADLDIAVGVAKDAGDNDNEAATQLRVVFDTTPPDVTLSTTAADPNSGAFDITATFTEDVMNVATGDFNVTNGAATAITGSGAVYTITITPSADGTVSVNLPANTVQDLANNDNTASNTITLENDETAPTVTITSTASDPVSGAFDITATFSEAVTGFDVSDLMVANGTAGSFAGSGTIYTATITPSIDGQVTVDINAGGGQDVATNGNTAATQFSIENDETAPTVTISTTATDPVSGAFVATFTFSEDVTGFGIGDISIGNGSVSGLSGSGAIYMATVTPSADGTVTVGVAATLAQDAAGNDNTAATQFSIENDETTPAVTITTLANDPTSGAFDLTITFSEAVTGFDIADLMVGNGVASNFAGTGATYTTTITPSADGVVTVDLASAIAQDAAGNDNTAATQFSIENDETAPTVTITTVASDPTSGVFDITVTFSEAVTGFDVSDITVVNGIAGSFAGSGTIYTATITPSTDGQVTVDINADAGQDVATNGNTVATQFSIENDETAPTVVIASLDSDPTSGAFDVTFTFSEDVTGFDLADLVIGNGVASNFAGSGAIYTATITPSADGTVTIDVTAAVAQDAAGNDNTAATQFSIENDETAPAVTITSLANDPINGAYDITLTFSEDVTGLDVNDIVVGNGTAGSFTGSGAVYTATITPTTDGTVTVDVAVAVAQDAAGNDNTTATQFSILADLTAPAAPVITGISDDTGADTADGITNDSGLSFAGTAEANSTVEVFIDGSSIGSTVTDGSGNWTYDHSSTSLADGGYSITATATDAATNTSVQSSTLSVTIDTIVPVKPVITRLSDDNGPDNADNVTNDRTLIFYGTAEAFTTIDLKIFGFTFGTSTADANGDWIVDVSGGNITVGNLAFSVISTDVAGNASTSDNLNTVIEVTAPEINSLTRADANPTAASSVDFTATFSEPVYGLSTANFELALTGTQTANIASVSASSGTSITITIDNISGEGSFGLNLHDGTGITDLAGNALANTKTGEVYNTNFTPTDISLSASSILENNAIGDVVATISTTDADAGDTHTYSLVAGTGDTDNASFTISGSELQAAEAFDLETKASYELRIQTDDGRGGTFEEAFTITIDNVAEADLRITGNNDIPATPLGISTTFDVTVHNDGDATLTIGSILYPTAFGGPVAGINIAPASSQVVTMTFTPTAAQLYTGDITIITNGGTGILSVSADGAIITSTDNGQLKAEAIKLYPNPATDLVTIDLSKYNGRALDIQLYDMSGIKTFGVSQYKEATLKLDVSSYTNGLYLVQLTDGKSTVQKKIMIRK